MDSKPRPSYRATPVALPVAVLLVVLDQLTKHWALNALDTGPRDVVWTLRFNLAFNSGMAFSRGEGAGPIIGAVALVVIVVMVVSLARSRGARRSWSVAIGLIVGGAAGNLVDRLFRGDAWLHGSVVDFIDFQWWPIFNVADMGITIGGAWLLIATALAGREEQAARAATATAPTATTTDSGAADVDTAESGAADVDPADTALTPEPAHPESHPESTGADAADSSSNDPGSADPETSHADHG